MEPPEPARRALSGRMKAGLRRRARRRDAMRPSNPDISIHRMQAHRQMLCPVTLPALRRRSRFGTAWVPSRFQRPVKPAPSSLLRLIEISQIRRLLLVSGRHQVAVLAHLVGLVPDMNEWNLLVANILWPVRQRIEVAPIVLHHRPGTRQCVVGHGDFVMKDVAVGLIEIDALLDDAFAILMQRNAAAVEDTRSFEVAGFGFEDVEAAISVLIDPFADGIAGEGRLNRFGPLAPVGENSSMTFVNMINQDVGGLRQHGDLHWFIGLHHQRHAGCEAGRRYHIAESADGTVDEGALEFGPVLGCQWGLLSAARRLARIEWGLANGPRDDGPGPLACQGRIYPVRGCLRCSRHALPR